MLVGALLCASLLWLLLRHKLALYVQFVQVATYGAEAWQLDEDIESRIRQWNAYNLATITTAGTTTGTRDQQWVQRLKQQQIAPAYNLVGILRARRKKWLGEDGGKYANVIFYRHN